MCFFLFFIVVTPSIATALPKNTALGQGFYRNATGNMFCGHEKHLYCVQSGPRDVPGGEAVTHSKRIQAQKN